MIANLLIGTTTMVACLAIQCLAMAAMLRRILLWHERGQLTDSLSGVMSGLIVIMLVLLVGALLQIAVWAALFMMLNEFTDLATAFYHSVVNFATLGYGDMVMSEERRLLGALEALNGVLMIGLSTSALFTVLNVVLQRAWRQRTGQPVEEL